MTRRRTRMAGVTPAMISEARRMDAAYDTTALLERLVHAYSTPNYRNGWAGCVRMLRERGFDDRQVEAIIRSKWTRWAADASNKPYGQNTSSDLARFLDCYGYTPRSKDVVDLVRGTFEAEGVR